MAATVAVLKERFAGETRVAATPESVKKLIGLGVAVVVESGAGFWRAGASIRAGRRVARTFFLVGRRVA